MVKSDFFWLSGALWLDFVNTEAILSAGRTDLLGDFGALCDWLVASELVDEAAHANLLARADEWKSAALEEARRLRANLRVLCEKANAGEDLAAGVAVVNEFLSHPALLESLEVSTMTVRRTWQIEKPLQIVQGVASATLESLAKGELRFLKPCAHPDCILWFLDTSKNRSRRWCSMETCGNRHKVARHYERTRPTR